MFHAFKFRSRLCDLRAIGASRFFSSSAFRSAFDTSRLSPSLMKLLSSHGVSITEKECEDELEEPLLSNLHRRGLIETCVNEEELEKAVQTKTLGLYCGADPTAKSLHIGNLLPLMILLHFNIHGHNIYPLIGGATGAVGDPSGRSTERTAMSNDSRLDHVSRISNQLIGFFNTGFEYAQTRNPLITSDKSGSRQLKNNYEWWKDMKMLDFLAGYGRFIRVNQMLARDSIKNRLNSDQGIGFNEFTYQVLQAYDYYYLNKNFNVSIQVGGKDQYGNIVAGIDFISRLKKLEDAKKAKEPLFGLTVPLLTTAAGVKFGKSAGNAIFIDKDLTPSYDIYQFMYRTEDVDVQRFLYKFSLLPISVIDQIVKVHNENKKLRFGQRVLAMEICDLIHGDGEGVTNNVISRVLYNNGATMDADVILDAFKKQNMVKTLTKKQLSQTNVPHLLFDLSGGLHSKSEFRRKIKSGAVFFGRSKKNKVREMDRIVKPSELIGGKLLILGAGKEMYVAEVVEN